MDEAPVRCGRREFKPWRWYAHRAGAANPRLFLGRVTEGSGTLVAWTREPVSPSRRFYCRQRAWAAWAGEETTPPEPPS